MGKTMIRRVVRHEYRFDAKREANGITNREFAGGAVLNILQWLRPGETRFTVEGEGAEVWVCDDGTIQTATIE
jgi:hypothetical protein